MMVPQMSASAARPWLRKVSWALVGTFALKGFGWLVLAWLALR
jgi:hypothetical protein